MKKLTNKGFTLIEVMIVIAIIAILASIMIPQVMNMRVNENEIVIEMEKEESKPYTKDPYKQEDIY